MKYQHSNWILNCGCQTLYVSTKKTELFKRFWLERRCLIASDCTVGVFVVHTLQRSTECSVSPFTYYEVPFQVTNSYLIQRFDKLVFTYAGQNKFFLHILKTKVYFLVLRSSSLIPNEPVLCTRLHTWIPTVPLLSHPHLRTPDVVLPLGLQTETIYSFLIQTQIFTCIPV
jgi:hypothetical protein